MTATADAIAAPQTETEIVLDEWDSWMRSGGMSGRTVLARKQLVLRLARVCDPVTCRWQEVARFLADPRLSPGSRATYRADLKQWFRWLQLMDYRLDDPTVKLPRARTPRRVPRPVSTAALETLLASGIRSRTRTMVLLAAYQGLRVHEIAKLRGEDFRDGQLRVVGKGRVEAWLPVHPAVDAERGRYPSEGWWFTSPDDRLRPVKSRSVSDTIARAMARAGISGSAHQARHWFGTESLRAAGGNLRVAQELLRHANIASTAGYTAVDPADRIDAVNALPALGGHPTEVR